MKTTNQFQKKTIIMIIIVIAIRQKEFQEQIGKVVKSSLTQNLTIQVIGKKRRKERKTIKKEQSQFDMYCN
jgi:hypothetical protein